MKLEIQSDWDVLRLADSLSITEAACCIIGLLPRCLGENKATAPYVDINLWERSMYSDSEWAAQKILSQTVTALTNSIATGKLHANKNYRWDHTPPTPPTLRNPPEIDPWTTLIDVDDLKRWLTTKHLRPKFFFGETPELPTYLDPSNPRYSKKLAAAINVWLAMEDKNLRKGMSPKTAMTRWLKSNYQQLGLIHDSSNPHNGYQAGDINEAAISEVAKVANWDKGGAPTTPGDSPSH